MMRSGFRLPAVGGGLWSDPEAVALAEIARRVSTPRDPRSIRSPFTAVRPTTRLLFDGSANRWVETFAVAFEDQTGTSSW